MNASDARSAASSGIPEFRGTPHARVGLELGCKCGSKKRNSTSKTLNYFPIHPRNQIRRGVKSHNSPRADDRRVARFRIAADPLLFGPKREYAKSVQFDQLAANKRCKNLFEGPHRQSVGLANGIRSDSSYMLRRLTSAALVRQLFWGFLRACGHAPRRSEHGASGYKNAHGRHSNETMLQGTYDYSLFFGRATLREFDLCSLQRDIRDPFENQPRSIES